MRRVDPNQSIDLIKDTHIIIQQGSNQCGTADSS